MYNEYKSKNYSSVPGKRFTVGSPREAATQISSTRAPHSRTTW